MLSGSNISTVVHAAFGLSIGAVGFFCLLEAFSRSFRKSILPQSTWKPVIKIGLAGVLLILMAAVPLSCVVRGSCPANPPLGKYWPREGDRERIAQKAAQEHSTAEE